MKFLNFFEKVHFLRPKSQRLTYLRRTPRLKLTTPSRLTIVVPYKPMGVFLILLLLGTTIFLLFRSDLFLVRQIEIEGKRVFVREDDLRSTTSFFLARSIFFADASQIERRIKQEFLTVAKIRVEKRLPDRLVIEVWEREPLLKVETVGGQFLADSEGLIFASAPVGLDLPVLNLSEQKIGLGSRLEGKIIAAVLKITQVIKEMGFITLTRVSVNEQGEIVIQSDLAAEVLFDADSDIEYQLSSLQAILRRVKMEGKKLTKVDLRFQRPIVVY